MADQTSKSNDEDCDNLETNKNTEHKDHKHPDVDGGWAWVVAIGMATFYFTLGGFFRSFGVVFAAILEQFDQSASLTSLIPAVRATCLIFLGPAGTILSQRLTERAVIVAGAIIVSLGFVLSFFATSLQFLIFSIGMMPGLGVSFIVGPANVMLGRYFNKRRARAITVTSSLGCIGQIVVPIIMVNMIEAYSVQGALLIYGGIVLNIVLTGLIMKPIHLQHTMEKDGIESNKTDVTKQQNFEDCISDNNTQDVIASNADIKSAYDYQKSELFDPVVTNCSHDVTITKLTKSQELEVTYVSTKVPNHDVTDLKPVGVGNPKISDKHEIKLTSMRNRKENVSDNTEIEMEPLTKQGKSRSDKMSQCSKRTICAPLIRFVREMYPIELLRNPKYCLLLCSTTCSLAMLTCQQNFLFAMTESLGFSREQAAMFLSIFGLCDMIGRLTSGQLSDRKLVPPQYVMATSCFISSVAFCFVPLAFSIYAIIPLIVVIGCFLNVSLILAMPLLVETIGLKDFPKAFSLLLACHGLFATISPPLFGLVKDFTGRYDALFPISGGIQFVGGILLIIELFVSKRARKRQESSS